MSPPRIATVAGAVPFVELGVGDARYPATSAGRWDVAKWDATDARWSGVEPAWYDVSCEVIGLDDYRGHDRVTDRWNAGTATFTVANSDGWADLGTAPVPPAELAVRPGRSIRWGMALDGGPKTVLWRGVIDSQSATYDGRLADTDTVTVNAVDSLGDVGRPNLPPLAAPVGDTETATVRLHRILDTLGAAASRRAIDASTARMTATDLGGVGYDQLQRVADTTGGAVFGDVAGRIVYRHRDWQTYLPGAPPDATIGTVAGAVCPVSFEVTYDRADITTRAVAAGQNDTLAVVDDPAGIQLYGLETGPTRTDLTTVDTAELTRLASWLLKSRGRLTMPRIAAVTLDAATGRAARDLCATVDPTRPTRVRVVLERDGRTVFDRAMFVTSVNHSWDAGTWLTRCGLDDAAPWAAAGGHWDGANWDGATWAAAAVVALEQIYDTLGRLAHV